MSEYKSKNDFYQSILVGARTFDSKLVVKYKFLFFFKQQNKITENMQLYRTLKLINEQNCKVIIMKIIKKMQPKRKTKKNGF